jgi:hypothetical protein
MVMVPAHRVVLPMSGRHVCDSASQVGDESFDGPGTVSPGLLHAHCIDLIEERFPFLIRFLQSVYKFRFLHRKQRLPERAPSDYGQAIRSARRVDHTKSNPTEAHPDHRATVARALAGHRSSSLTGSRISSGGPAGGRLSERLEHHQNQYQDCSDNLQKVREVNGGVIQGCAQVGRQTPCFNCILQVLGEHLASGKRHGWDQREDSDDQQIRDKKPIPRRTRKKTKNGCSGSDGEGYPKRITNMPPGMTTSLSMGSATWKPRATSRGSSDRCAIDRARCLAKTPPTKMIALPI